MKLAGKIHEMNEQSIQVPILSTTRLNLEPMSLAHSQGMFEMWCQPAVQEYSGPAKDVYGDIIQLPARTPRDSDKLICFWEKAAMDGWGFRWVLLLKDDNSLVGHIGFNSLSPCSEIAYHMNPKYWGQGYMTEAAKAALEWRKAGGATGVEAFIDPRNTNSIAVAFRLGMNATNDFSEGARRYRMSL